MKKIRIGNQVLDIKDYYCCQEDGIYIPRNTGALWLYIIITDVCNGNCPFCINPGIKEGKSPIDLKILRNVLLSIKEHISGVTLTGGEPFLDLELLTETMEVVVDVMGDSVEIDTVTNGVNFQQIPSFKYLDYFASIHLSRHSVDDDENNKLFGFETVSLSQIKDTLIRLSDPGKIVLNCVLQKGYTDSVEKITEYLEMAADIGIENTSFIGLSKCNDYCRERFVDPQSVDFESDSRFHAWNHYKDYDYCSCSSGSYNAKARTVRYYYRCLGTTKVPYARQLVYDSDNKLYAGYGGEEILF